MASEASGRSGKQPRVAEAVQVSRGWKGVYQADYPCPKCKSLLASKDDTLLGTDTCPNFKAEFVFGSDVQTAYSVHKADVERKEQEKRLEEEEREYDERSKAEKRQLDKERAERVAKSDEA